MTLLAARSTFTPLERRQRQRLIVRDAIALSTLLAIAVVLSFTTYLLFHSFEHHRQELAQRWKARGEVAMKQQKPALAVNALHSALAYEPDDRGIEIELATALAAAGRTQEAVAYFNTLREAEPGNGLINLQLARLAAQQGNAPLAVDEYQASIDGTWFGDGFVRRRAIRFELSRYLISLGRINEARSQLLIAAGNAPEDMQVQLAVGSLLAEAGDARDALDIYRRAFERRPVRTESLIGAAQAASELGRYAQAKSFAEEATGQGDFARQPDALKQKAHTVLTEADAVLALYAATSLEPRARAQKIVHSIDLVKAQLDGCGDGGAAAAAAAPANGKAKPGVVGVVGVVSGAVSGAVSGTLRAAGIGPKPSAPASPFPASPQSPSIPQTELDTLRARLTQLPAGPALARQLERDPSFAQSTLQLVYDTEKTASATCKAAPLSTEDASLLKIARAPDAVEQM